MRKTFLALACMTVFSSCIINNAAAARLIPGYQCLDVKMTPSQAADPNWMLVVRTGPSEQSPVLGTVGGLLIAADPVVTRNGYIQIMRADASVGWVPSSAAKPWHSADPNSNVRCYPAILDNGRVGMTTKGPAR